MIEKVILVDSADRVTGEAEKLEAHRQGVLHRAFSIFIFNSRGELLVQQRALGKYHSGGLWTNTCCGHPRPGEATLAAGERRLAEETGIVCTLQELCTFTYRHEFSNGLTEHEYDHVLVGFSDATARPDPAEIMDLRYIWPDELALALAENPEIYTAWLRICYEQVLKTFKERYQHELDS